MSPSASIDAPTRRPLPTSSMSQPPRSRPFGFTTLRDLRCSRGHHIREDAFFFEHGAVRCKHREPLRGAPGQRAGHGAECGALVYVLACSGWTPLAEHAAAAGDGSKDLVLFTAEVTYKELEEMRRRRLSDVAQVLDFLGVRFPTADR